MIYLKGTGWGEIVSAPPAVVTLTRRVDGHGQSLTVVKHDRSTLPLSLTATSAASLPHLLVDAEKVLADPTMAGAELARFVGLTSVQPGSLSERMERGSGGLPNRFADGHWQAYSEALAESFAKLPS